MLKLDNSLLDELGLGSLPEDQKRSMLQHIYETLELRVGTNLANQMTDQQLEEFERFIDDGGDANQAQALQWLETNLPNYKQVVNEVFEALKVEIGQMAPQLLAASAQTPQQQVPTTTPAPAAPQPYGPQPPAPNDYYVPPASTGPVAGPSYAPPTPPVPNNGGAPAPAPVVNDFGAGGMSAPTSVPDPAAFAGAQPQPAAPAPQPAGPAGFMPLPADPIAGGQQQVVQPAPTPYDQPTVPFSATTPNSPQPQPMPPVEPQQPASQPPEQDFGQPGQANYPFPAQQPPAGPGNYPPQHPSR